jgi:hypothetical protein
MNELVDLIYGGGLVYKAEPDGADLHVSSALKRKKRERTQARVALASNIVGGTAGVAATGTAWRDLQIARGKTPKLRSVKALGKLKTKYPLTLAGGALALQAGNNIGDVVANRVLARESKKKITKGMLCELKVPSKRDVAVAGAQKAAPVVKEGYKVGKGQLKRLPEKIKKSEIVWEGEFSKISPDKQQVFGWASVVEINGEPVVDLQGDYITIDEVEKSAYEYVIKSRKGGDMHRRAGENGEIPLQFSDMIESFVVTPEKIEKMGLPDTTPIGWWVGYKVNDPEVWAEIKSGKRTGFSLHGRGQRVDA